MKRYYIQIKDYRSSDSSRRAKRFTIEALNLNHLDDFIQQNNWGQYEIEILSEEEIN